MRKFYRLAHRLQNSMILLENFARCAKMKKLPGGMTVHFSEESLPGDFAPLR